MASGYARVVPAQFVVDADLVGSERKRVTQSGCVKDSSCAHGKSVARLACSTWIVIQHDWSQLYVLTCAVTREFVWLTANSEDIASGPW